MANARPMSLADLPLEMTLQILEFLSVKDILLGASLVCKTFQSLCESSALWKNILTRDSRHSLIEKADICQFGWKALARTHLRTRCAICGAKPSFVIFYDNSRKCPKCCNTSNNNFTQFVESCMSELCKDNNKSAVLNRLGLCLARMGKHMEANSLLERLLAKDREVYGSDSTNVIEDLISLARVCRNRNSAIVYVSREKAAIANTSKAYLLEVMEIKKKLNGPNEKSSQLAECYGMLGGCENVGAYWQDTVEARDTALENSKKFVETAVEMYEELKDDEGLASILTSLSGIYRQSGFEEKAIECNNRALQLAIKVYGPKDFHVADAMQSFGYLYWNLNKTHEAYLKKSLEWHAKEMQLREELMGVVHPVTQRARQDVAILLSRLERTEELQALVHRYPELHQVD